MKIGRGGKFILYTLLCILAFVILVTIGNTIRISTSQEFSIAKEYLKSSPEVLEKIGEVKDFGNFPSGSIKTKDGNTYVQIETMVQGVNSRADVILVMSKKSGTSWSVDDLFIKKKYD